MKELRRISKSPCFLIVLLISFIFICLISNQFSNNSNTQRLLNSHDFERKTLLQALRKASMSDRTVILAAVNETWAKPGSILDLFLESFRIGEGTKHLLNHLLIIAEDRQAFHYCKSKHPLRFQLKNLIKIPSRTQGNLMLSPSRLSLLVQIIELGYHVAYTNADTMWLRNPLSELAPDSELSIACELHPIDAQTYGINGDGGFFHLKANARTYEFIKNCNLKRVLYPDSEHHSLIQANCCEDIDSKIHDLKLVLDDWRNFTELSANSASSKWSPLSWRAPQKCIV